MCTRTLWNDNSLGVFVSRTMDWATSTQPRLMVFPRGQRRDGGRLALGRVIDAAESLQWTSEHGSVVVSIYDAGSADGLNERGVGAHMLYFTETDFGPRTGKRASVHAGLWVQLILDLAADVTEAIALLDEIDLVMVEVFGHRSTVHVAIEDSTGDSAILEYVGGERKIYHGREHVVMTNDPAYDMQLELFGSYDLTRPTRETPIPGNVNPRDRFVRAAYYCKALPEPSNVREAVAGVLAIARNVSVPFGAPYKEAGTVYNTEYRTVLDLTNRRYFFEHTMNPSLIWLELDKLAFTPGAPVMSLDPEDGELVGNVSNRFAPISASPF